MRWTSVMVAVMALLIGSSAMAQDATGFGGAAGYLAARGRTAAPGVAGTAPARATREFAPDAGPSHAAVSSARPRGGVPRRAKRHRSPLR